MVISPQEFEQAALVVVVSQEGVYQWSSDKSHAEVAGYLRHLATTIESEAPARVSL